MMPSRHRVMKMPCNDDDARLPKPSINPNRNPRVRVRTLMSSSTKKVWMTGPGLARPVVSMMMASSLSRFLISLPTMRIRSPRTAERRDCSGQGRTSGQRDAQDSAANTRHTVLLLPCCCHLWRCGRVSGSCCVDARLLLIPMLCTRRRLSRRRTGAADAAVVHLQDLRGPAEDVRAASEVCRVLLPCCVRSRPAPLPGGRAHLFLALHDERVVDAHLAELILNHRHAQALLVVEDVVHQRLRVRGAEQRGPTRWSCRQIPLVTTAHMTCTACASMRVQHS